jgi:hypothetical protein
VGDGQPPQQGSTPETAAGAGESRRLSDILSDVFAEQERVAPVEMQMQQLGFFRKELRHMVGIVEAAPMTGWSAERAWQRQGRATGRQPLRA